MSQKEIVTLVLSLSITLFGNVAVYKKEGIIPTYEAGAKVYNYVKGAYNG